MGQHCYSFKLWALDGAMVGALVDASDIFLPEYADVTLWGVVVGGVITEQLTAANAQARYEGYTGSCPPVVGDCDPDSYLFENGDCILIEQNNDFLILE